VLPTMHQSSLGSVILLAGPRLHPLWHTGWLPLLFLISCIAMGYGVVVLESMISGRAFRLPRENKMLGRLGKAIAALLLVFVVGRFADILWQSKGGLLFGSGGMSVVFWVETLLFLAPALYLLFTKNPESTVGLLRSGGLVLLAGTMYRFDAYIVAFDPGPGWTYFPTLPEILITVGLVALEILVYILLVKRFPILSGRRVTGAEPQGSKS